VREGVKEKVPSLGYTYVWTEAEIRSILFILESFTGLFDLVTHLGLHLEGPEPLLQQPGWYDTWICRTELVQSGVRKGLSDSMHPSTRKILVLMWAIWFVPLQDCCCASQKDEGNLGCPKIQKVPIVRGLREHVSLNICSFFFFFLVSQILIFHINIHSRSLRQIPWFSGEQIVPHSPSPA
jgi:hypothetical protein